MFASGRQEYTEEHTIRHDMPTGLPPTDIWVLEHRDKLADDKSKFNPNWKRPDNDRANSLKTSCHTSLSPLQLSTSSAIPSRIYSLAVSHSWSASYHYHLCPSEMASRHYHALQSLETIEHLGLTQDCARIAWTRWKTYQTARARSWLMNNGHHAGENAVPPEPSNAEFIDHDVGLGRDDNDDAGLQARSLNKLGATDRDEILAIFKSSRNRPLPLTAAGKPLDIDSSPWKAWTKTWDTRLLEHGEAVVYSFEEKIKTVKTKDNQKTAAFSEVPAVRVIKHKAEAAWKAWSTRRSFEQEQKKIPNIDIDKWYRDKGSGD